MVTLHQLFYEHFRVKITDGHVQGLLKFMYGFETRGNHPQALGTPMLGIYKAHFLPSDDSELFSLFGISYSEFKKIAYSADSVTPAHKVASDPYNLLTIWLVHLFMISDLSNTKKYQAQIALLKMMQYRIFTSVVHYRLKHGANEGIMQYTLDNDINNKFDIKKYGTWKALIEYRADEILVGTHREILIKFAPDEKGILYAISDIQTRLRKQLGNVINLYYENHKKGNTVNSVSAIEDINGDTSIRVIESFMDSMVVGVVNSITNLNEFIDHDFVAIAVGFSNDIDEEMFGKLLSKFSTLAETQLKRDQHKLVKGTTNHPVYEGYQILISTLLQKTYRKCIHERVDMKSKVAILNKTRDIYRSSRISDDDILAIKDSVDMFVNKYSDSRRPATNTSLRIAFIIYFILLSFKHFNS